MGVDVLIFSGLTRSIGFERYLGPYRIATSLREQGYTVQVVDFFDTWTLPEIRRLAARYIGHSTLWIGFSSTFYLAPPKRKTFTFIQNEDEAFTRGFPHVDEYMRELFDICRQHNPRVKFVLGGSKAGTPVWQDIDFFLYGYSDNMIVQLTRHIQNSDQDLITRPIPGFSKSRLLDWRSYPIVEAQNLTVVWDKSDHLNHGEMVPIEISRGCIFRCKFCSYPLNGKRKGEYIKDPEILYQELVTNYERWGITRYIYADDTHNDDPDKLVALKKVYDRLPFRLNFVTYIRGDLIHAHPWTAELLQDSGLISCYMGIETVNPEAGKIIGKGLHPNKMKETLHRLKSDVWGDQITIQAGFIIGLPTDTEETGKQLLAWLTQKDTPFANAQVQPLDLNLNISSRLQQSEFELNYAKYGYQIKPGTTNQWISPTMTRDMAARIANEIGRELHRQTSQHCSSFTYMPLLNVGLTIRDINTIPYSITREKVQKPKFSKIFDYKRKVLGD